MRIVLAIALCLTALGAAAVMARPSLAARSGAPTHLLTVKLVAGPPPQGLFQRGSHTDLSGEAAAPPGMGFVSVRWVVNGALSVHRCAPGPCRYQIPVGANVWLIGVAASGFRWMWWMAGVPGSALVQHNNRTLHLLMTSPYTVFAFFQPPAPRLRVSASCNPTADAGCLSRGLTHAGWAVVPSDTVLRLTGLSLGYVWAGIASPQNYGMDALILTYGPHTQNPPTGSQPRWVWIREDYAPYTSHLPDACAPQTRVARMINHAPYHSWGPWTIYTHFLHRSIETTISSNLGYQATKALACAITSL